MDDIESLDLAYSEDFGDNNNSAQTLFQSPHNMEGVEEVVRMQHVFYLSSKQVYTNQ